MATKYKEYFERMIQSNKEVFDQFASLHFEYSNNQDSLQEQFNLEGSKIMAIIKEWENKLCSQSEKAGYGGYTNSLSEKFWQEVRKMFPLIDYVGVIVKNNQKTTDIVRPAFEIKKINL